jgi:YesN/AraC family two-component response regulator
MKMPGMNGIEFIRMAKKEFPEIHYYILTGYDISDEISKALQEGLIDKYFRKPFNMREIDFSIREAMGH